MKKLLALLACALLAAAPLDAQTIFKPSEVTVSRTVVTVDGKQYLSHVVRERQTLYSIGKAYGVSSLDIIDANPSLNLDFRSIKAGDILLIPATEETLALALADTTAIRTEPAQEPVQEQPKEQVQETLPEQEQVPLPEQVEEPLQEHVQKPLSIFDEGTEAESENFVYDIPECIKVCILLPFDADSTANVRYLNYYFGTLLAAKDLSDQGVKMEISTIDTMDPQAFTRAAGEFADSDVIIGPVSAGDISKALPLLPEGKMLVSPMDAKTEELTVDSPVILAATPASRQVLDVVEWMQEEKGEADTLIVVRESGVRLGPTMQLLRKSLNLEEMQNCIEVDYSIAGGLEMNEWFGIHTHMGDTATRVMALSERDVFVKDVIRNVYLQNSMKHNVTIYGPARTRSSEVEEMCNAYLHNSVTYNVDYDNPEVIRFVGNYRALFHTEPDSFAFHGYDTMRYFVSICAAYGRNWPAKLHTFSQSGLQTYFRFEPAEGTGNVNAGLRRVLYTPGFNIYIMDK